MAIDAAPLPLTPASVRAAHKLIKPYIHLTPLLTSQTLNTIITTPTQEGTAAPKVRLYLKCENFQKIGAFKARGAYHALIRLIERLGVDEVRRKGVVTHSSGKGVWSQKRRGLFFVLMKRSAGNHAQALALAAKTFDIPSYIVMPKISTPSKIKGSQAYSDNVVSLLLLVVKIRHIKLRTDDNVDRSSADQQVKNEKL